MYLLYYYVSEDFNISISKHIINERFGIRDRNAKYLKDQPSVRVPLPNSSIKHKDRGLACLKMIFT